MGELITAASLNPPAAAIIPAGAPLPAPQSGFNINMGDIKEIISMVSEGIKNFKEIQSIRAQYAQPIATQNIGTPEVNAPPLPIAAPRTEVKMIQTKKVIDRARLKVLLNDLIVNQATKLPADLKEKKVGELVGENWIKFNYRFNSLTIDSEFLTNQITEQLGIALDGMIIDEVSK